ncbi:hypothetical protein ACFXO2_41195 [Streptomyces sp. NPDC059152]|uniref:hypothetical protein n=1 Tax=Streptomyces sp. NPDC059152 TaxID=3346742 RepID=UPI0036A04A16
MTTSLEKPLPEVEEPLDVEDLEPEEDEGQDVALVQRVEAAAEKAGASVGSIVVAFAEGNEELVKKIGPGVRAWCRRGHRGDLDGLSADLGVWLRVGVVGGAGYGLWRLVEAHPGAIWPLVGGWCVACLRARVVARKKAGNEAGEETPTGTPAAPADGAPVEHPVVALVRASIGDAKGVHLKTLLPLMRERLEGLSAARSEDLKELLAQHGLQHRPKVRVGRTGGIAGIHRDDLPPLPSPKEPPTSLPTPLPTGGDAGQSVAAGSRGEPRGAARESAGGPGEPFGHSGNGRRRTVQDPDNPQRWHYIPD